MMKRAVVTAAFLAMTAGFTWAQHDHGSHGGHGGHSGGSGGSHWDEDRNYDRIQKIEKKKMKIEAKLQDPNLKPAKRAKLEEKLEELRSQR